MKLIRFFIDDPLLPVTHGRYRPNSYLSQDFDHRLAHGAFVRKCAQPFIPREMLLLLEKSYSQSSQFGSHAHLLITQQIAAITA